MLLLELDIKNKTSIGHGAFNYVFPYEKFQDKIIKTSHGNLEFIKNNKHFLNKEPFNIKDVELMAKYPQFCAKVFRIRPNYAIVEKLDTRKFLDDVLGTTKCLFNLLIQEPRLADAFKPYINVEVSDPSDISLSVVIDLSHNYPLFHEKMSKNCGSVLFNKLYKLIVDVHKSPLAGDKDYHLDIHDGNFGYNKNGDIKFLDI